MSTPSQLRDPLVRHYFELIVMLEQLVLARVPRLPLMPAPKPLDSTEVLDIATKFAAAHSYRSDRRTEAGLCFDVFEWAGFTNVCELTAGHAGAHAAGQTSWNRQ